MAKANDNSKIIHIDTQTHTRLEQLAKMYDSTIIELVRELVDSEWLKQMGEGK